MESIKREREGLEKQKKGIENDIAAKLHDASDYLEMASDEVLKEFDINRRKFYLMYVKSAYVYKTHLSLEFMNGKLFIIQRARRHNCIVYPSKVSMSYKGEHQMDMTYTMDTNSIEVDAYRSGDKVVDDAVNAFNNSMEDKVNWYLHTIPR